MPGLVEGQGGGRGRGKGGGGGVGAAESSAKRVGLGVNSGRSSRGGGGGEGDPAGRSKGDGAREGKPFAGMRMILFGFPEVLRREYNVKVVELGATLLQAIDYETATHIVVVGNAWDGKKLIWNGEGKAVVSKDWIDNCYYQGKELQDLDSLILTPNANNDVSRVISTSKKLRLCVGCSRKSIKRKLCYEPALAEECHSSLEEEIMHKHHQIFHCTKDGSSWTSLHEFCTANKDKLTDNITTPGTDKKHISVVTSNELKSHFKSGYKLMKNLRKAGLTLRGQFSSKNFITDKYKNMRLSVPYGTIKKLQLGDAETDAQGFVDMIRNDIFSHLSKLPFDIENWLKMVGTYEEASEELTLESIYLMEERQAAAAFKTLYNMFEGMRGTDPIAYQNVQDELDQYKNWKRIVKGKNGNTYLSYTLKRSEYPDDVVGLLDLLRNTREHSARLKEHLFFLIVSYNFPHLMADFQRAMFKEGYVVRYNT